MLTNRIRSTDELGWFDNQRIGVLLSDTSAAGAWRLAEDLCQAITAKASLPECNVYTYASGRFSDGNGHSAQLHFQDVSQEWKTAAPAGFCASAKHAVGRNVHLVAQQLVANKAPNYGALAEGLDLFFQRPLPAWKRSMDVVGALLGLVVLSPLLLLVTLIIKIVSPGPVFFKQQRVGYMGKAFTMWKFRTMKLGVDTSRHQQHISELVNNEQPMTKLNDESQIIPFGKILRATCLDELPQLINVLSGEMSLVGPRPVIPYEVEEYQPWYNGRFDAVPGMTGLWQVSGKNWLTINEMVRLDIQYLRKKSPWLDIKILLMTPHAIVSEFKDNLHNKQLRTKGTIENA